MLFVRFFTELKLFNTFSKLKQLVELSIRGFPKHTFQQLTSINFQIKPREISKENFENNEEFSNFYMRKRRINE